MIEEHKQKFLKQYVFIGRNLSFMSPNSWTLLSLVITLVAAYFLAIGSILFATVAFAFSGFTNIVDGAVAYVTKKKTVFGALLAETVVKYSEGIILLLMAFPAQTLFSFLMAGLAVFGALLTDYVAAKANISALYGRTERYLLMLAFLAIAVVEPDFLTIGLIVIAFVAHLSVLAILLKKTR